MDMTRRAVLSASAAAAAAGAAAAASVTLGTGSPPSWEEVRALFPLNRERVHMSAMLITSHPEPVAAAIERHRRALDADPVEYLRENGTRLTRESRAAAARRLDAAPSRVALTDSTTQGVGLVYGGLDCREGDEIVAAEGDYYVTHEALRLATARTGAEIRLVPLGQAEEADEARIVERLLGAIGPRTRLLALTWVNSGTGLKLPVARIAAGLKEINDGRDEADAVLFGLDAVHGFAVEPEGMEALGVDYFMAGCHKWLFGPRGTGIVGFSARGLEAVGPTIPSFDDSESYSAWYVGREPRGEANGPRMSPGGFKPFEHRWALADAFDLHASIGRERVAERTHALAGQLKEGLAKLGAVTLATPRSDALSAGIVAFGLDGTDAEGVVEHLRARGIVASVAPYPRALVRLTPSVRNSEDEVDKALAAVAELA